MHNYFILSHDLARPHGYMVMCPHGFKLLKVSHQNDNFCDHGHCGGGDMFSFCHVNSWDRVIMWSCDFLGKSRSRSNYHPAVFVVIGIVVVET